LIRPLAFVLLVAQTGFGAQSSPWADLQHVAREASNPLPDDHLFKDKDAYYLQSFLNPGVLLRMRSQHIRFFGGMKRYEAEGPSCFWIKSKNGAKTISTGESIRGDEMAANWILTSFQGARGWEQFDVPWFLALENRPTLITLDRDGLRIDFATQDTGHIFSMPLYGYQKLPQSSNRFAARHGLPSLGLEPWTWLTALPKAIIERCDWWAGVARAFPVGFQESFSVDPKQDEITFRQEYRWFTTKDAWGTKPRRFAALPPAVALVWKLTGFPITFSIPVHDPEYFTAYGPFVGCIDADRIEFSMRVLQYVNELEQIDVPAQPDVRQKAALNLIAGGITSKFPSSWQYFYDHGERSNFCWNIVGDVWYPRALPFVSTNLRDRAASSLGIYMRNDVLRPHSPFHGKYILHGPGIGSWGEWGDAAKIMTSALQAIWAYAQYTGDWALIRDRWDLIRRFFSSPDTADWLSYGRSSIAEIGDQAAPCSAFARMAWETGDVNAYLTGVYMFSRELITLFIKQRGGVYFYQHQPYNQYQPMPPEIYPTDTWGSTRGWQVDGPTWGHLPSGEHQSANRWVRFHDPDVGRFYRDHLAQEVKEELDWYEAAGRKLRRDVYRVQAYQEWLTRDSPHIMPSLVRLRSLLTDESLDSLGVHEINQYRSGWGAADIAVGYSLLRKMARIKYERLLPASLGPSPYVLGQQRQSVEAALITVQDVRHLGLTLEPRWHGWDMPKNPDGTPDGAYRSFGLIQGDFGARVAGAEGSQWLSYGCRLVWANAITPRNVPSPDLILRAQDQTPVAVIGPFPNSRDEELLSVAYPPENQVDFNSSYPGLAGMVRWQHVRLLPGRRLDLSRQLLSPQGSGALAYVVQFVWSPESQPVYLLARHHGGIIASINGVTVIQHHGIHRSTPDDGVAGLGRLEKGWNKILLKVESFTGDYTFQFRLVHLDRQPIPGLKFSLAPTTQ